MSRASIVAVTGVLGLIFTGTVWARKVAPIAARCPEETKRQIDWEERRDMCLQSLPPACPDGTSLREDSADEADQCLAEQTDVAMAPVCPENFKLHVRTGPDLCGGRIVKPDCRRGFRLHVLPGEDMCVH
jgi:hypothetical protein